ncbi:uncharacterized protein LOC134232924 [Saccostrea cucullata]|uniref:uncharacterized protein LOC134232924 n=1 Tax=Saccostrea cuccullata TaxID=36930 RepID=UPI002ED0E042
MNQHFSTAKYMKLPVIYMIKRITCTKVLWQKGLLGEKLGEGTYANLKIECKKLNYSMTETTLKEDLVTLEDIRKRYYVMYNNAKKFRINLPQEDVSAAVHIWDSSLFFIAILYTTFSISV